jgi:type II restriction enzyme
MTFTFEDLLKLYSEFKKKYGEMAYKHISELFDKAKQLHKEDWLKHPTPDRDHEQSWRAFKGNNFEKLIMHIIQDKVESLGLKVVRGEELEGKELSEELSRVKRNVLVNFGEFGCHLPDADLIIYNPKTCDVVAIVSCKTSLRERLAQTAYWKLKFLEDPVTKHIKVLFITIDEKGELGRKKPAKKCRAIAEVDLNGSYIVEGEVEESEKVKTFDKFIDDLKEIMEQQ